MSRLASVRPGVAEGPGAAVVRQAHHERGQAHPERGQAHFGGGQAHRERGRCGPATAGLRLAGYAALFEVADAARDTIRRGAFARTLRERTEALPLLWEHRPGQRIGTVEQVAEDARGLRVIARVERMESRAAALLAQRAVSGLSFGYRTRRFRHTPAGRVLEEIDLLEISLVRRPLQPRARVHWVA